MDPVLITRLDWAILLVAWAAIGASIQFLLNRTTAKDWFWKTRFVLSAISGLIGGIYVSNSLGYMSLRSYGGAAAAAFAVSVLIYLVGKLFSS